MKSETPFVPTANTPLGPVRYKHWEETVFSLPLTIVVVALLEVSSVPVDVYRNHPGQLTNIFVLVVAGLFVMFSLPILFGLCMSAMFAFREMKGADAKRFPTVPYLAVTALASVLISLHAYIALAQYPAFKGHIPFVAFFVVFAVYLFLRVHLQGLALLIRNGLLSNVVAWGFPILDVLGFGGLYFVNNNLYATDYPTLHHSALIVGFLLLHQGLLGLLVQLKMSVVLRRRLKRQWIVIALQLAFVFLPFLLKPTAQEALPLYLAYTTVGRSDTDGAKHIAAMTGSVVVEEEDDGISRFQRLNNLPKLPADFQLTDYNILFIAIEATRYDYSLGPDKLDDSSTTNLYKFARDDNWWFSKAYSPSMITSQVFPSLFSMSYPSLIPLVVPMRRWRCSLSERADTVAELLEQEGYSTFWIGHSFPLSGCNQGFQSIKRLGDQETNPNIDDEIQKEAIRTLESLKNRERPFFGWLFFASPHSPYLKRNDNQPSNTPKQRYLQELKYGDEQIGKVLSYLKNSRFFKKTIVIVIADHGEEFGEHRATAHTTLHAEATQVPMIVHIPGQKGRLVDGVTSTLYVFPWLFLEGTARMKNAAAVRINKEIAPMLKHTDGAVVVEKLWQDNMQVGLIYNDFRLHYDLRSGMYELYDAKKDPRAHNNVFTEDPIRSDLFRRRVIGYLSVRNKLRQYEELQGALPDPE